MHIESPPLNDEYPERDVDTAERTSSNRVHRLDRYVSSLLRFEEHTGRERQAIN